MAVKDDTRNNKKTKLSRALELVSPSLAPVKTRVKRPRAVLTPSIVEPAPTIDSAIFRSPEFQELICRVIGELGSRMPLHPIPDDVVIPEENRGRISSRARAEALKQRMNKFRAIYQAGWIVRNTAHGDVDRRATQIYRFCEVLAHELATATDYEALIYAVAHTLTCSPYGVPWES
jgi:hypothetical protein